MDLYSLTLYHLLYNPPCLDNSVKSRFPPPGQRLYREKFNSPYNRAEAPAFATFHKDYLLFALVIFDEFSGERGGGGGNVSPSLK